MFPVDPLHPWVTYLLFSLGRFIYIYGQTIQDYIATVVYKIEKRHTKSMLSALNFIETRCTLNANVKHTMHLNTSLIWSAWVHHLTMKIYKFWYWFFFFIKLPKWSVLAVSGENQLLCWRGMHIRRRIRIKWMQIARLSICYQHLRRYGGLWLIEWLLQLFPLRIFLLQEG